MPVSTRPPNQWLHYRVDPRFLIDLTDTEFDIVWATVSYSLAILACCAVATQTSTRTAATIVCGRSGSPISSHDQITDRSGCASWVALTRATPASAMPRYQRTIPTKTENTAMYPRAASDAALGVKGELSRAAPVRGTEMGRAATRPHAITWPPGIVCASRPPSAYAAAARTRAATRYT